MIEEALTARLAALTPGMNWHALRLPRGEATVGDAGAGTYQRISTVRSKTHSGDTRHAFMRYQLTVYSERYQQGRDVARIVAEGLAGVRQTWSGGLDVSATLLDEAEDVDPEPRGLFRQRIDVQIGAETWT